MSKQRPDNRGQIDTDADRYPTLKDGLSRVIATASEPDAIISRIDVRFDAGGHGYYRYWVGREEEPQAGAAPL